MEATDALGAKERRTLMNRENGNQAGEQRTMKSQINQRGSGRGILRTGWCLWWSMLLCAAPALFGQQQFRGTCAQVKIEIQQTLTTERIGFEATLRITNNQSEEALTDFAARLTFRSTGEDGGDAADLFFVRKPSLEGINDIDGGGVLSPTKTAVVRWFIIPKPQAGGTDPRGKVYRVGCELGGSMGGLPIPQEQYFVIPDTITVKPEPRLDITYFQPRDVQGDDPFTEQVESPIPFTLGVLVKNTGYAPARNVVIDSEQPRIVENKQGLLLVARLLGARVQDSPLDETSLTVNLGDIPPGEARKGAWDMITSLSGEFVEFKASYTHAAELGGEETSLIESLEAHFIAAEVLNDEPGRDDILDFLADTDRDDERMPDALYESNGNVLPVNTVVDAEAGALQGREFTVTLRPDAEGWGYARLDDPGQAKFGIEEVVRSDGKVLNLNNVWTNIRYDPQTNEKLTYFNILDRLEIGEYNYTVTYAPPPDDTTPPETRLRFAGEVTEDGENYYITRDTQLYFTSEDISPVSIFYKVDNGDFRPALPFSFREPGSYEIIYYAEDLAGNREAESFARLIIPGAGPGFDNVATAEEALFLKGDVLSARSDAARIAFTPSSSATQVDADITVWEGVRAFPRIGGVPPSPSPLSAVSLTISGDYVDYYRYRLNGGSWSAEEPVAQVLELSGLSGEVELEVLGRSQYGEYPEEAEALQVNWVVDATAVEARIGGLVAIPASSSDLQPRLEGDAFGQYRWTVDEGYYRAAIAEGEPFDLEALASGTRVLSFNTDADGEAGDSAELSFALPVDPAYGSEMDGLNEVYAQTLENVAGNAQEFAWDGRDGSGILQRPGWYTVRVALRNPLGQDGFFTRLVRIEELTTSTEVLADAGAGARNLSARGGRAVWQQREGTDWDIWSRLLTDPDGVPQLLTEDTIGQESPATDGRWVVWQERRPNLSTDILVLDAETPGSLPMAVTETPGEVETNPVVDWPWVVFERRPLGDDTAVRQLVAHNLDSGLQFTVDAAAGDQSQAGLHAGRVVWRDERDVGGGEIYFSNLETGETRRLTESVFGQFFPAIRGHLVVWQDNRNGQVDLYGYDLREGAVKRLTDTPFNEAHPYLVDRFVLYEEDSLDPELANLRILDTDTGLSVPLTRGDALNEWPAESAGQVVWQQRAGPLEETWELRSAPLPALQLIAENANAVPVTAAVADRYGDAHGLLAAWNAAVPVLEVSQFTSLEPQPVQETASWDPATEMPGGTNFALESGRFLWVRFGESVALDLGPAERGPMALEAGLNVVSHTGFPAEYSAYELVESIGASNVGGVRLLDARAGLWHSLAVDEAGDLIGPNFRIPTTAVLLLDMKEAVASWNPQRN